MNTKLSLLIPITVLGASCAFGVDIAQVAVGTYDPSGGAGNDVDSEASGNSFTLASYQSTITSAFANGTGGVVEFTGTGSLANGDSINVSFDGGNESVSFTHIGSETETFGIDFSSSRTAISGSANEHLTSGSGTASDRNDFEFAISGQIIDSIAITVLSRDSREITGQLIATLDDATTISTGIETISMGNGIDDTFFVLSATPGRHITSFLVDIDGSFTAIDDLGFTVSVIPEPSTYASILGLSLIVLLMRRRLKK